MGYYVTNIIAIRTGGVFGGGVIIDDLKEKVFSVIRSLKDTEDEPDLFEGDPFPMSDELVAHKGSYVVIAGVFNYWKYERSKVFVKKLSETIGGNEIFHVCWDEQTDEIRIELWLSGKAMLNVDENTIGRVLRRLS